MLDCHSWVWGLNRQDTASCFVFTCVVTIFGSYCGETNMYTHSIFRDWNINLTLCCPFIRLKLKRSISISSINKAHISIPFSEGTWCKDTSYLDQKIWLKILILVWRCVSFVNLINKTCRGIDLTMVKEVSVLTDRSKGGPELSHGLFRDMGHS